MNIRQRLFFSHVAVVLLISGSAGTYFYVSAIHGVMESLQSRLRNSAAMAGAIFDARSLTNILTAADVTAPEYTACLKTLRHLCHSNPDLVYAYIMRKDGDQVRFVADSDESGEQALPGEPYEPLMPWLLAGFDAPSVDAEVWSDEWGAFISGYAPLDHGRGTYMIGIDMPATEVRAKLHDVRLAGLLSLACSVLLALLFSRLLAARFGNAIHDLAERCRALVQGGTLPALRTSSQDEFIQLTETFSAMATSIREDIERRKRSKEELEKNVIERTSELLQLNGLLTEQVAERKRAEIALEEVARRDSLTGLLNRRAIQELLHHETARATRHRNPFAVLIADVDHFKQINDTYGHLEGDRVLGAVAGRLREGIRGQDYAARWGGEEFLLLLPETTLEGAVNLAERLRARMAETPLPAGKDTVNLSISVGITTYIPGEPLEFCLARADAAMYDAKRSGRDRVITHPPPTDAPKA